jgi:hypothetical protein
VARLKEVAEKLAVDPKCDHRGLKPALILGLYAALKRRSSTVVHAFVSFFTTSESGALSKTIYEMLLAKRRRISSLRFRVKL